MMRLALASSGFLSRGTSSGTLEIPKETGHGIWKSPHKLQFSPDGLDSWCVSLFTVVLVVVLDPGDYMRSNCIFQIGNRPFLRQTLEKVKYETTEHVYSIAQPELSNTNYLCLLFTPCSLQAV